MAVMGNKTAEQIVLNDERNMLWDQFEQRYNETKEKFSSLSTSDLQTNLYRAQLWMFDFAKVNLENRQLPSDTTAQQLLNYIDLVTFLRYISIKELENADLSAEEIERIHYIGGETKNIFVKFIDESPKIFTG